MNIILYSVTTLIWSSTSYAIKLQLGVVPPAWSIAYRFFIAASILLAFCFLKNMSIPFSRRQHLQILAQSLLMFSGNYLLFYQGTFYLITGLVSVIFAGTLVFNIIFSRLFFKKPILVRTAIGAILGITGLIMVFWSQFATTTLSATTLYPVILGAALSLAGAMFASLGNMIATINLKENMAIIQMNALGMLYGSVALALYACCFNGAPVFDWNISYISALLYLALFGSVFAFGAYVSLMKTIGADKAAYSFVVIPLIAMLISTVLEGFHWTFLTVIGTLLVMFGNVLVLTKEKPRTAVDMPLSDLSPLKIKETTKSLL